MDWTRRKGKENKYTYKIFVYNSLKKSTFARLEEAGNYMVNLHMTTTVR